MKKLLILLILFFNFSIVFSQGKTQNCEDHPSITSYPYSVIKYCDTQIHKEFNIGLEDETNYRTIGKWEKVAGKVTRIYYSIEGDRTVSEVYKNYIEAIKKADFTLMVNQLHPDRNVSTKIGGNTWLNTFYISNPYPTNVGIKINQNSGTMGGTFYIAAKSKSDIGNTYFVISGKQYSDKEVVVLLDVIEETEEENDFIKIDAQFITKKLKQDGFIGFQDILFDFNKATLKTESEPLLDEISKVLIENPSFKIYIVGHTDMKGELDYNIELSKQRASSVVDYLVKKHNIAANRLSAQGVGPLSPLSTNETEEGRTKNRRVELILMIN